MTAQDVDLVHGNALVLTSDGNLLLSSRNQSEVTKIDLQTGDIIWRLGGKANEFTIDGPTFAYQHDVRAVANGDVTVFDNQGTTTDPAPSSALEYQIDEANKTAKVVWQYTAAPPVFGTFMGNNQLLPDGNRFISWGAPWTGAGYSWQSITEVSPDGQVLFDLAFDQPYVSYRALRFPWEGSPDASPDLAAKADGANLTLGYSWNGATDVALYKLYAGADKGSLGLIQERPKADFETQSHFSGLSQGQCYYQVTALSQSGQELGSSDVISTSLSCPASP